MTISQTVRDTILKSLGTEFAQAYPKTIEKDYPHVLEKIAALPNAIEREKFFDDLLLTQRSDRRGFSTEAFSEITTLIDVYQTTGQMPRSAKREGDVWVWIDDVGIDAAKRTAS